jgi:hypothetical protein
MVDVSAVWKHILCKRVWFLFRSWARWLLNLGLGAALFSILNLDGVHFMGQVKFSQDLRSISIVHSNLS